MIDRAFSKHLSKHGRRPAKKGEARQVLEPSQNSRL
jgi:hypothetical protein